MNKLIYKGNLNDFDIFAGLGIVKGNWNERALKYLHYLGATSSGLNTAQKQIEKANLETLRLDFINQDYAVGSADTGAVETKDTFDNILTFSRGSTGTYFDSAGVLQTAAVDEPRFTHDPESLEAQGLLIEEQRTNLLLWSEAFDDASWVKVNSTILTTTEISPDGVSNFQKIIENFSETSIQYRAESSISITAGNPVSFTVFAKKAEREWLQLVVFEAGGGVCRVWFGLDSGVLGSVQGSATLVDHSIEDIGNGIYRCSVTAIVDQDSTNIRCGSQISRIDGEAFYQGDGTSGLYVWGAQAEEASTPSSYIKTEGSQVTRSADNCSRTLGDEYNSSEGRVEAVAKNHTGEFILNLGTQSTLADVDTEKTYTLTYSSDPSASTLDLLSSGAGTVKSVKYYPREAA